MLCEEHAIWNRSVPKVFRMERNETEGSPVKSKHVNQNETSRKDIEKRRRLRLFELFERKEAGFIGCTCTHIFLCVALLSTQHAVFILALCLFFKRNPEQWEKNVTKRKTSIKDGEKYKFNSIILVYVQLSRVRWWRLLLLLLLLATNIPYQPGVCVRARSCRVSTSYRHLLTQRGGHKAKCSL